MRGWGDGGDGGPNPPPPPAAASLTVSRSSIAVSATPGQPNLLETVTLTIDNPPDDPLHIDVSHTGAGIVSTTLFPQSPESSFVEVLFRAPGSLANDTYADTVTVRACLDAGCSSEIEGSPATISTLYEVEGNGLATASIDRTQINFTAGNGETVSRTETARIRLTAEPAFVDVRTEKDFLLPIDAIELRTLSPTERAVDLRFTPASDLDPAVFHDTVTVTLCYETNCARQVEGSPFTIDVSFQVIDVPDPGITPLSIESRVALPHNIVDAEYSPGTDTLVMVATHPANRVYVYSLSNGVESHQLLSKAPTSVSVSPNGVTAAIGHDALISVVDIASVGPGAPAPVDVNVSADVFDLVLDGTGKVHAMPRVGHTITFHSIDISSNTEEFGTDLSAGTHGRLHPAGEFIYTADNGISPSDIQKNDIRSGVALQVYDSPYHGDHDMCGNVWFSESGSRIYTPCGNTFSVSDVQAEDMIYSGSIVLATPGLLHHRIESLSQADAHHEIALAEDDCEFNVPCTSFMTYFDSDFLNLLARYPLPVINVAGTDYEQRGLFVFHDVLSNRKYLLSRLEGIADPDAEYYLSVIP